MKNQYYCPNCKAYVTFNKSPTKVYTCMNCKKYNFTIK